MISFFSRKTPLIDIWSGTPDIHCHVLPGIDDGAADLESSIAMLQAYKDLGCSTVIATPHIMEGIYDNTRETISEAEKLVEENHNGIIPKIAAEYMLDSQFEKLLTEEELLYIADRNILIEMSYFQPPRHIGNLIFKIISQQYKPILAHPERYSYYHKDLNKLMEFKKLGCTFQLNALSLSGHYGENVKKVALALLKMGAYNYIGTDAHKVEHLRKLPMILVSQKYSDALKEICSNTSTLLR